MTTELLWEIEERLLDGESCYRIGKELGIHPSDVSYWRDKLGIDPGPPRPPGRPPGILTIRNARTGKLLAHGTGRECAEQMGLSYCYIQQLESKIQNGEITKYTVERE